ncbi:MAG: FHA domain-containing protein, partial [Polyangiaceae bacterium]
MIPGFGKQKLTIGSDPKCDIVLQGHGVAAHHANLVHNGDGTFEFTSLDGGPTFAGDRQLGTNETATFDFRTTFRIGEVELPFGHRAIALSMMLRGTVQSPAGRLVLGRDPLQVDIVLAHRSVSSLHCTVALDRHMLTDHGSTSGSYIAGQRIAEDTPAPLPQEGDIHVGPVPIPISVLHELAQAAGGGAERNMAASAPPPLAESAPPASPAPVAGSGMRKHKTVFGQLDFSAAGGVQRVGRTPDNNDIVVPHAQVSSQHAQVEQVGSQLYVTDLGSANGTYVRGHRIPTGQKIEITSGEKIYVGPMPLQLVAGSGGSVEVVHEAYAQERWAGRPLYEIEAWSLFLQVPDRDDKSTDKVLLDNISFKALPGDMIALMGPSGAGKTTLLLALNGYLPPSAGMVRINGEDLYSIFDTLRGSIGYVPQDDLVHPELTVWEATRYSAKFRLPPDYSDEEIDQRVQQTLRDLGLESVAHLQIGKPEKKILSGGQRKRVNIALELVTDPVIIYLDEPTSGLAADDAAGLVHLLSELTHATGKTIIMTIHQPAKEEYEKFSHALVLGYGGVPMFFGSTTPDSYEFFGSFNPAAGGEQVDNPQDMFAKITEREDPIYEQLLVEHPGTPRAVARQHGAVLWRQEYFAEDNPIYKKMYSGRRSIGTGEGQRGVPEGRPKTKGQFRLLLSRYFKTKVRDVGGTVIMLAQAPIIGALLALVFSGQEEATPAWCLGALQEMMAKNSESQANGADFFAGLKETQDHTGAVFFLVVSAVWFGTSNAAREIVRERAIYLRERMINLSLANYVMSKFFLLSVFCVLQCTMLLSIVFFTLGFHGGIE